MTRAGPSSDPEDFELAVSTSHLLHRAQQLAADRFTLLVGENSVTLRQFAVLAAVAKAPGLSQAQLVRSTGIDRSTLAEMMLRMERRGWVMRSASDLDGRAHSVRLAPEGAATLSAARQHARAADAAILDALPRAKRKAFLSALEKLTRFSDRLDARYDREARRAAKEKARLDAKARKEAAGQRVSKGKRKRKTKARGGEQTHGKKKRPRAGAVIKATT